MLIGVDHGNKQIKTVTLQPLSCPVLSRVSPVPLDRMC